MTPAPIREGDQHEQNMPFDLTSDVPRAIVLAEPAAWKDLRNIKSQYADVGTRAKATHDSASVVRQAR